MIYIDIKENRLTDRSIVYDIVLWEEWYDLVGNQKYFVLAHAVDKEAAKKCVMEIKLALSKAESVG